MALDYDAELAAAQLEQLAAIERRLTNTATAAVDRGMDFGACAALARRGASLQVKERAKGLSERLRRKLPDRTSGPKQKRRSLLDPSIEYEL